MPGFLALSNSLIFAAAAAQNGGKTLPGLDDPVAAIAVGVGAIMLIYLFLLRPKARQARRRPDPLNVPASRRQSLAGEREAERAMQSIVLQLEQMSRQIGAQVDTKAAKLEALIAEADEKIQALGRAVSDAPTAPTPDRDRAAGLAAMLSEQIRSSRPAGANENETGLAGLARHGDIYRLADEGLDASAIAGRLRRPRGEVELILALRKTGGAIS